MKKLPKYNDKDYVHFVTSNTWNRTPYFKNGYNCLILLSYIDYYQVKHRYKILAYCIMPDHFHLLIASHLFPAQGINFADGANQLANQTHTKRITDGFTPSSTEANKLNSADGANQLANQTHTKRITDGFTPSVYGRNYFSSIEDIIHDIKGKTAIEIRRASNINGKIWQKSFYDFPIYSQQKLEDKMHYIHNNPVSAGLVKDVSDYPWSSQRGKPVS